MTKEEIEVSCSYSPCLERAVPGVKDVPLKVGFFFFLFSGKSTFFSRNKLLFV